MSENIKRTLQRKNTKMTKSKKKKKMMLMFLKVSSKRNIQLTKKRLLNRIYERVGRKREKFKMSDEEEEMVSKEVKEDWKMEKKMSNR